MRGGFEIRWTGQWMPLGARYIYFEFSDCTGLGGSIITVNLPRKGWLTASWEMQLKAVVACTL